MNNHHEDRAGTLFYRAFQVILIAAAIALTAFMIFVMEVHFNQAPSERPGVQEVGRNSMQAGDDLAFGGDALRKVCKKARFCRH